jgi:hypothetical protein
MGDTAQHVSQLANASSATAQLQGDPGVDQPRRLHRRIVFSHEALALIAFGRPARCRLGDPVGGLGRCSRPLAQRRFGKCGGHRSSSVFDGGILPRIAVPD